jgi:uncharacterized BrkB/YihY/UPF0761 family membrane protein
MEMVNKSGNAGTASTSDSGHDFPSRFRGSRFVYLRLLREVANAWSDHRVSSMGAALAFYATFSIAPILVITIAIAGFFFGAEAARGEVVAQFHGLTGESGAKTIQTLLAATYNSGLGFWASVIAVITLLVAATSVFAELKNSLDVIWGAQKKAHSGIIALIRGRLLSFGLILTIGAAITAALFTLGKFLIGLYLGNSQLAAGFGAAGSLVVILLWVYYSSQIFFIGAEMTHAYAGYRADRGLPGANPASGNPAGRRL